MHLISRLRKFGNKYIIDSLLLIKLIIIPAKPIINAIIIETQVTHIVFLSRISLFVLKL